MLLLSEPFHEQLSQVAQQFRDWSTFEQLYATVELTRQFKSPYRYFLSQIFQTHAPSENAALVNHNIDEANTPSTCPGRSFARVALFSRHGRLPPVGFVGEDSHHAPALPPVDLHAEDRRRTARRLPRASHSSRFETHQPEESRLARRPRPATDSLLHSSQSQPTAPQLAASTSRADNQAAADASETAAAVRLGSLRAARLHGHPVRELRVRRRLVRSLQRRADLSDEQRQRLRPV